MKWERRTALVLASALTAAILGGCGGTVEGDSEIIKKLEKGMALGGMKG